MKTIAIQGGRGAFHEIAARKYFQEELEIYPYLTFEDMFDGVIGGESDYAIMAIENSLVGSILHNYALLKDSGLKIIGEVNLRIRQHLLALPGQKLDDIQEVFSHPMAIQQCRAFFKQSDNRRISMIDSVDTALSAKDIREKNLVGIGTIASELAAQLYDLEIVAESIETNKKNYTRFLIITDEKNDNSDNYSGKDKVSLCFTLPHEEGSLASVLSVLTYYKINLTKVQSLPILGREWEYLFYVDLMFKDYKTFTQALSAIVPLINEYQILGVYKKGIIQDDFLTPKEIGL